MKKNLLLLLSITLIFSCSNGTSAKNDKKLPFDEEIDKNSKARIHIEEKLHDFGKITEGKKVMHNFVVKNVGKDLLKINKVRASCGCTAVVPKKNELKEGESTTINVEFDSEGRLGKQKKSVYIYSNDPTNSKIKIQFKVFVNPKK